MHRTGDSTSSSSDLPLNVPRETGKGKVINNNMMQKQKHFTPSDNAARRSSKAEGEEKKIFSVKI